MVVITVHYAMLISLLKAFKVYSNLKKNKRMRNIYSHNQYLGHVQLNVTI